MPIAQPLGAFIFTFLGFCFGFFFDLYRVLRRASTPGQLLTAATDLLFWFTYTIWVYIVLLRVNMGEVRAFLLLCLALGAGGYFYWFSPILLTAWGVVFDRIARMLDRLGRMVTATIRVVVRPYHMLVKHLILPVCNGLYWLFKPLILLPSRFFTLIRNEFVRLVEKYSRRNKE